MTSGVLLALLLAAQAGDPPPPPDPIPEDGFRVRTEPNDDDDVLRAALVGGSAAAAGAVGAGVTTALAAMTLYSSAYAPTPGLAITLGLAGTALAIGVPFAGGFLAGAATLLALGRYRADDWADLSVCVAGGYCGLVGIALFLPLALLSGGPVVMCRLSPCAMSSFGRAREPGWMSVTSSPAAPPVLGAAAGALLVGVGGAVAGRLAIPGDVRPDDVNAWLIIGGTGAAGAAAGAAVGAFFGGVFAEDWAAVYD